MPIDEKEIGRIIAQVEDARDRVNEAEERMNKRIDELLRQVESLNNQLSDWKPLLSNMSKQETDKRSISASLIVLMVSNAASWILAAAIWFIKSGVVTPGSVLK
jgi:cell division septum initiation protein DivIVA